MIKQSATATIARFALRALIVAAKILACKRSLTQIVTALGLLRGESGLVGGEAPVNFNKDIAPIIFEHCSVCHRPGQSGPFSLLNYDDVKSRAKKIVEVTAKRFMPPWLPEGPL